MSTSEYKYSDITGKVIGCAMKVHSHFGMGFPEVIYNKALLIELKKSGLAFQTEIEKEIYYNNQLIGKRRLDLIIEGKVLVELKAAKEIETAAYNQILNYLRIFNIEVGLLVNFGETSLQFKRLVLTIKHT